MTKHAVLSPSGAARWLTCTAAPRLEAQYKEETSSYAAEGTFAHALAELETQYALGLKNKSAYTKALNKMKKKDWYSEEMLEYVGEYSTYIKETFLELEEKYGDAVAELEVKLNLEAFIPEGFGTADCVLIAGEYMYVIDFKYGKGVRVEAEGNPQMKLYALGALERYKALYAIEHVRTVIIQPRMGGGSQAEISVDELLAWGEETVIPKAKEALSENGTFCPSEDACRFCKARGECRARADYFVNLFDESDAPETLSAEEAGQILLMAADMENWLKALRAKIEGHLLAGEAVEGWKLVESRTNRKYTDEAAVAEKLIEEGYEESQVYTKKVIGISSVEKMLGKKKTAEVLGDLVYKPEGTPALAEASDKRPEISVTEKVISAFDEE